LKSRVIAVLALAALLCGCAEHKEYEYREFQVSRENAYHTVKGMLAEQQYDVVEVRDEDYREPEIYMETNWNLRQVTPSVYRGNAVRRKAYVRIITRITDRKPREFQPLEKADKPMTKEEKEKWEKDHADSVKKGAGNPSERSMKRERERIAGSGGK
jgi:MoaA/NifB/PqqE/SkfB family radical SAM enzyme